MTEPMIEFKWLEAKPVGNEVVVFHLEDGTTVKARVSLDRAGVATNFKNPDGTNHYSIGANLNITIIPAKRSSQFPEVRYKCRRPQSRQTLGTWLRARFSVGLSRDRGSAKGLNHSALPVRQFL